MDTASRPRVSVIMVDGDFRPSFHAVDSFCSQDLGQDAYEVLWVEHSSRMRQELRDRERIYPHFRVLCLGRSQPYHSSFCFNAGIAAARADVVFIPDGDVLVTPDFLRRALEEHAADPRLALYFYRVNAPPTAVGAPADIEHVKRAGRLTNPNNYGGCLSVRKSWLEAINGYEQHPVFALWDHTNGADVHARLKILGLHVAWHPDLMLYHPWHPGTERWAVATVGDSLGRLQQALTQRRAMDLRPEALRGLDPSRNGPLPDTWRRALDVEAERLALPPAVRALWQDEDFPLETFEALRRQKRARWRRAVQRVRLIGDRVLPRLRRLPQVTLASLAPASAGPQPVIDDDRNLPPRPGVSWRVSRWRTVRLSHDDITPLVQIVAHRKPRLVLELGTAHGNATANICRYSNARVVTVNALPEQLTGEVVTFALEREHIGRVYRNHGFADRVTQIYANTLQFRPNEHLEPGTVDLAVIDACHDFEYVRADFLAVAPMMRPGGMVLLHDTHPSRAGHLRESYDACVWLRGQGFDIRHIRGTWWGCWVAGATPARPQAPRAGITA